MSANELPTSFTFTGQREAEEIGLMYYVARWYDSEIGYFLQADTIVPGEGNPQAYNRFSYTGYNPTRYSDPTGHGIFDTVADFVTGVVTEGAKSFWWFIPQAQEDLAPSHSESTAMLVGRVVADVAGVVGGVNAIISGGGMMASGGAACVLTLGAACAIVPEALVAGAVVATAGASMVVGSVTGAVDNGVALFERLSETNSGGSNNRKVNYNERKIQHIYGKHGEDFGFSENWNKRNGKAFFDFIESFINDPDIVKIQGTYRGTYSGTHYYQPSSNLWVFIDSNDNLLTGFKLRPDQIKNLFRVGNIQ